MSLRIWRLFSFERVSKTAKNGKPALADFPLFCYLPKEILFTIGAGRCRLPARIFVIAATSFVGFMQIHESEKLQEDRRRVLSEDRGQVQSVPESTTFELSSFRVGINFVICLEMILQSSPVFVISCGLNFCSCCGALVPVMTRFNNVYARVFRFAVRKFKCALSLQAVEFASCARRICL